MAEIETETKTGIGVGREIVVVTKVEKGHAPSHRKSTKYYGDFLTAVYLLHIYSGHHMKPGIITMSQVEERARRVNWTKNRK